MELRQLRYFVAVARELHFGRAARALTMAQPPLSQQIQKFERELGMQLFARTNRSVELTDAGRELFEAAREIVTAADHLEDFARSLARGSAGELRIGTVGSALNLGLASLLNRYRLLHPDVKVTLEQLPVYEQVNALNAGTINVGFTTGGVRVEKLEVTTIRDAGLVAVLPRSHRFASLDAVRLEQLRDEPFIGFRVPRDNRLDNYLLRACAEAGFVPRLVDQGPHLLTMINMVAVGMGVALVPDGDSRFEVEGVVFRPLAEPAPRVPISIVRHEGRPNRTVDEFVAYVRGLDSPLSFARGTTA